MVAYGGEGRLNERDRVRVKHDPPRGILNLLPAEVREGLSRYWPSAALAPFVEHYWIVRWDVREPRVAETVPHPSVHMVLGPGSEADVVGLMRTRFTRVLEGRGRVLGTKFRPGRIPSVRAVSRLAASRAAGSPSGRSSERRREA